MSTVKSNYNEITKVNSHTNEKFKVHWRKHCALQRTANKCKIYIYTSGGCDSCGHNRKLNPLLTRLEKKRKKKENAKLRRAAKKMEKGSS